MRTPLDTRPWNLLAGLALASTACSGRTAADAGTTTSTGESATSDTGECSSREDCPPGYYCVGGVCEYLQPPDGGTWYECYSSEDCGVLAQCLNNNCVFVDAMPSCGAPIVEPSLPVELGIPEPSIAIAFADVDSDGADELLVVSTTDIYTLEFAAPTQSSARDVATLAVDAIATGELDLDPGEDLALLFDETVHTYSSDGLGGFAPGSTRPSSVTPSAGLRAGDLDGAAPDEVVVWGEGGAAIDRGDASTIPLTATPTRAATLRPLGSPEPGLGLHWVDQIAHFDPDGAQISAAALSGGVGVTAGPLSSGSFAGTVYDVSAATIAGWTLLQLWRPGETNPVFRWGMDAAVLDLLAADFDGDGDDELAILTASAIWLVRDLLDDTNCIAAFEFDNPSFVPGRIRAGDYDGDGDDELAADGSGWIFVVDVEGP